MSDEEEPVRDIRSRIAAFETVPSSSNGPKPIAKKPVLSSRVVLPLGQSDPLSIPSRNQPVLPPSRPSSAADIAVETARPKPSNNLAGSVQLVGLAKCKPPTVPDSSTRPPIPLKPASILGQSKGDQLNTSPTSVKSLQSHIPLAPSRSPSPASSPSRVAEEEQSLTKVIAPPTLPPRLPARKPTAPPTLEAAVVVRPPSPHLTSPSSPPPLRKPSSSISNVGGTSPKPVLPPRKAATVASSSSSLDADPFASPSRAAPPQRNDRLSASPSRAPTTRSPSTSVSDPFADTSKVPARSSINASQANGRPLQSSTWSAKPQPPSANPQSAAPVSGSSLSTFATRAPLVKSDINGPEATSRTGMSVGPEGVRRYAELWTGMLDAAEVYTEKGQEPRLDALIVREVWKSSKLSEEVLGRIWSQCDTSRQGSLNRFEFCLGLSLVDEELTRRKKKY